jgi:hypothetical protein
MNRLLNRLCPTANGSGLPRITIYPMTWVFMVAADDEFYLANQGIYGTKGEAISRLKDDLGHFRQYAEQSGQPDAFGAC